MANEIMVKTGDVVLVERFPCLGFMSVRPQKVQVTDDPMCKYTIRASGNSLVSLNLDFDGDTLFIASFHTPAAKLALKKEWTNPNPTCYREIKRLNERKGAPHIKCYTLQDYNITPFGDITCDEHAVIVEKNTGIKAQTGPVIALTYNIMRIMENSDLGRDQKVKVAAEMFLEKAAQSVFEQKHGGKSLYEIVIEGVCTANVEMLVEVGFKRGITDKLCNLVTQRANAMGIFDLTKYHQRMKERGGSNLISRIVREQNVIYFASRSQLGALDLLQVLEAPAVDIPSRMWKWVMAGKADKMVTVLEDQINRKGMENIRSANMRSACSALCEVVEDIFNGPTSMLEHKMRELRKTMSETKRGMNYAPTCDYWGHDTPSGR